MLRKLSLILALVLVLTGCAGSAQPEQTQYNATFLTLFDTVTTIVGRAESREAFTEAAQGVHDKLQVYHQLFDIYNDYEGRNNLKTVNDNAGQAPVKVDPILIDLLTDCKEYYSLTDGRVNVAMGSVLQLWHEARSYGLDHPDSAALPDMAALEEAAGHTNMDDVVIDREKSTVFLTDPQMRLDVGAVAKGWAVQRVAEESPTGLLISVGGNVCATGPKDETGTPWVVGINDPDGGEYLHTIYNADASVVTSGDYQRYFVVDGKPYHHIIDPDTRMPGSLWRSVTIVCGDSGLADALSTALFLLPLEEGQALAEKCGAEVLWMDASGQLHYTPGFRELIKK